MLIKHKKGFYVFEKFLNIEGLVHGFSTREFGNMNQRVPDSETAITNFTKALHIEMKNLVRMEQVHGSTVRWVSLEDRGSKKEKTDGLLTEESNVFLYVNTADCMPVLFYDQEKQYAGIAHIGWRGLYNEISKEVIAKMSEKGSNPKQIQIGIGPSIQPCCYTIDTERKSLCAEKYPEYAEKFLIINGQDIFLDMQALLAYQLKEAGVPLENIEDSEVCTKDNEEFYSYRLKKLTGFGSIIGRL